MKDIFNHTEWPTNGILLEKSLNLENQLCRYTSLKNLYYILEGKFYIPKRGSFSDAWECDGDVPFNDFKISLLTHERFDANNINYIQNLLANQAKAILASCWTNKYHEDYLMWKSYTPNKCGAMLRASIHNIASSFGNTLPHIICSNMIYQQKIPSNTNPLDALFFKATPYHSEEEVRFYILPDMPIEGNGTFFKINPEIMIDEIILSPFLTNIECSNIIKRIENNHSFLKGKIHRSTIELDI